MRDSEPLRERGVLIAASCAFVATALFRYLALAGFPNDQFEHLAGAQQMLFGEWPTKDFVDPGMPLTYAASAAAQLVLGRTLFAEAVLNAMAFGLAAACTVLAAYRLSRSLPIAVVTAALSVAMFPRPYAYPKLLVTAVGPLAIWAWMSRPTLRRMVGVALVVVLAFLFRYDYGAYLGVAALAGIVIAPADGWRERVRRASIFCALVAILLAPYALYLDRYEGLTESVRDYVEYGRRHADRTQLDLDELGTGPDARLFYGFHALPFVALACLVADWLRRRPSDGRVILPLAICAVLVNVGFIRDPLSARLADAAVPPLLLGAWLTGRAWRMPNLGARVTAVTVCVVFIVLAADAIFAVGSTREQIDRTGLQSRGLRGIPSLLRKQTEELEARYSPRQAPDARLLALVPFFDYLDRCTTTQHRLLTTGYAPEVYVYSRRLFAGGMKVFMQGYSQSAADQRRIISRMDREVVPFVLLLTDLLPEFRKGFPRVNAFVEWRFKPMAEIPAGSDRVVRVLVNTGLRPARTDPSTGWPCYL